MNKIFLICFILTIILMCMKNMLFLVTFGLIFIIIGLNKVKTFNSTKNAVANMKRRYENYNIGSLQKKILMFKEKISDILLVAVGSSLCLWYIFYLVIKYIPSSTKFILGGLLPINILIFPLFLGIFYIAYVLILKEHKAQCNIKILAQCINVEENISYTNTENFSQRIVNYITTFKYEYNNNEYTVSTLIPQSYPYMPQLGCSYDLFINENDPYDFYDPHNDEKELNFKIGITFIGISLFILFGMICIWIKSI